MIFHSITHMLKHYTVLLVVTMLCITMVSDPALAQEVDTLYSEDIEHCEAPGLENLFSGFVCSYQEIVDEILTTMYIEMVDFFREPFFAGLTLFLAVTGSVFALGMLPFTTRDIMISLAKISLLTSFAMNPELMIDLVYQGLIGFMYETTNTVVGVLAPQGSVAGIFEWMDEKFYEFISMQDDAQNNQDCDNDVLALMFGLAITMPPVFAIAMYILVQLLMVLIKSVLGYLIAMTGIMFLTTLAPLFLGFALFKFTSSLFEKWLVYLLGFAFQIFIVFSFIAAVLSLPFETKLQGALDTIQAYDETGYHDGQRLDFNNWCTVCASQALGSPTEADICTGDPIDPTNVQVGGVGEFIDWVGQEILILGVMAYIMTSVLNLAPDLAKYIATRPYAPDLQGRLPFENRLSAAGTAAFRNIRDSNNIVSGTGAAARDATAALVSGRP